MPEPIRVGILNDMSSGPPGPANVEDWLQLAVDELLASGRLDRPVEFIHSWGLGLPQGTAAAVEHAYRALVEQDVLLIIGPAIGDNALVATPLADRHRVPTINWAGSERARSNYMFHLQVGSHEDESIVIARHLAAAGGHRLAVFYDKSPIGRRYLHFLQAEAEILGLEIVAVAGLPPMTEEASGAVERVASRSIDSAVYLGLGHAAPPVAEALNSCGWEGYRMMNTAGIRGHHGDYASAVDGWVYLDMYSDHNRTLSALLERLDDPAVMPLAAAKGYDLGRLTAEGIARAGELSREGIRAGLEGVKWLPAAEGQEGTQLGFGHYDRGALHGRYLVTRQWLEGKSREIG